MRYLMSTPVFLENGYDGTAKLDNLPKNVIVQLVCSDFETAKIKLPFNGNVPIIQKRIDFGVANVIVSINENITVTRRYFTSEPLILCVYSDDDAILPGEKTPVVIDSSMITKAFTIAGRELNVSASVASNGTVNITCRETTHGRATQYIQQVEIDGQIYYTDVFALQPTYSSEILTGYTGTRQRFLTAYI